MQEELSGTFLLPSPRLYGTLKSLRELRKNLHSNFRLTEQPVLLLQETTVLNLCTLYELESSYAGQKKRAILDLVARYRGDAFGSAALKLQV